jgi:hypothetical protein
VRVGRRFGRLRRQLDDFQIALVHRQIEDILDRIRRGRGADINGPAQIALLGVEVRQRRQPTRIGHRLDAAEALQRPNKQLGLIALAEEIGGRRQPDPIVPQRSGGSRPPPLVCLHHRRFAGVGGPTSASDCSHRNLAPLGHLGAACMPVRDR